MIDLAKSVAKSEQGQSNCGFYVVLQPRDGQHFEQPTRLEMIMNHESNYLKTHRASDASKQLQK